MKTPYSVADTGEAVKIALSQGATFHCTTDGQSLLCLVLNGDPAALITVLVETGEIRSCHKLADTEVVTTICSYENYVYIAGPKTLFRYDPQTDKLSELGQVPCESVIVWDVAVGQDGKLYGVGYPNSFMFSYDPVQRQFNDLGSVKPGEDYARGIVAGDGKLYIGIGTNAHIVEYDIANDSRREIPFEHEGQIHTVKKVYAIANKRLIQAGLSLWVTDEDGSIVRTLCCEGAIACGPREDETAVYFKSEQTLCRYDVAKDKLERLDESFQWPATEIKAWGWIRLKPKGSLKNKLLLAGMAAFAEMIVYDPETDKCEHRQLELEGQGVPVQNLHCDPEGRIIAGGYHRGISMYDPDKQQWIYTSPHMRQIEGMLNHQGKVYLGTYKQARIYRYDPAQPYSGDVDAKTGNPGFAFDPGGDQDRPFVFASGEEEWYAGTIPDYGQLGGALIAYRPAADGRQEAIWLQRHVIPDQSIIGLAYNKALLYGGTSIYGGLGVQPAAEEAKLFVWDTRRREMVREHRLQIAGEFIRPKLIGALSFGADGLLWGAADVDGLLFAMEPVSLEVVKWRRLYPGAKTGSRWRPYYILWDREGMLWTTAGRHISKVDPLTMEYEQVVAGADVMTIGLDDTVYYASGSRMMALSRS